ncbi:MAG: hypothetical protein HY716_10895 [Planctomycetes bacterium]|nr:hypothetical protein [Planctomycetota bacterium]
MKDYDERETVIRIGERSETVSVWTCQKEVAARLRRKGHRPTRTSRTEAGREVGSWFEVSAERLLCLVMTDGEDLLDLPADPQEWSLFANLEGKVLKTGSKWPFGGGVLARPEI